MARVVEREGLRGAKAIGIQSAICDCRVERNYHAGCNGCICICRLDYARRKIAWMRRRASKDVKICKTTNIPAPKPPNMVGD